ncbi:NAD-dependent epimerase/dehydratase family protein [Pseudomonadota bacterium]
MKVLVTGGGGFIGQKLVDRLVHEGCRVRLISRHLKTRPHENIEVFRGDLLESDFPFSEAVDGCNLIYHCAGEIHNPSVMKALHVDATQRMISAALKKAEDEGGNIHWVQLSSVGAYGPPNGEYCRERIVTEETVCHPVGEYETTKAQSDEVVMRAGVNRLFTYTIVRPSNVFGFDMPNQSLRALGAVVKKNLFFYIGKPGAVATYVHVDDVVEVLFRCGTDPRTKGEVFNLSNDCLLEEMIDGIALSLNARVPRLRLSESLANIIIHMGRFLPIPLTRERVNALTNRTRYPHCKLREKLNFVPQKPVPVSIGELFSVD